ncbi:MAG: hypothetical protein ACU837_14205 [Gammaproteobacteria bacterium]
MGTAGMIGAPMLKSECPSCGSQFWDPDYKPSPVQCKWYHYQHDKMARLCPACGVELAEHRRTFLRKIIATCIALLSLGFLVSLDRQETALRCLAMGMVILPLFLNLMPGSYAVKKPRQPS